MKTTIYLYSCISIMLLATTPSTVHAKPSWLARLIPSYKKTKTLKPRGNPIYSKERNCKHLYLSRHPFATYPNPLYDQSPTAYLQELEREGFSCSLVVQGAAQKGYNGFVSKVFAITNPNALSGSPIHLTLVHGTFSNAKNFGGDETSLLTPAYKVFATQLAQASGHPVYIHVFTWSGKLSKADRKQAGQRLAQYLYQLKQKDPYSKLWLYAHSHGCNVGIHTAQALKQTKYHLNNAIIPIDSAIFVASPTYDVTPEQTPGNNMNILSTTVLWGDLDLTGRVGSLQNHGKATIRKPVCSHSDELVRNIRIKFNNIFLNHINVYYVVIRFLAGILQYNDKFFPYSYNVVYNITTKPRENNLSSKYRIEGALEQSSLRSLELQDTRSMPQEIQYAHKKSKSESLHNIHNNKNLTKKANDQMGRIRLMLEELHTSTHGIIKPILALFS